MSWWLIAVVGYLAALGLVLLISGGVRRGDERHQRMLQQDRGGREARRPAPERSAPVRAAHGRLSSGQRVASS